MLLSAFGIFFVVDMHAGSPFGIFNTIFDYESYFMQMFVFISGYFFTESNLKSPVKYIWKNTKKLIVPYLLINLIYVGLIMLAKKHNPEISWYTNFSLLSEGRDTVLTLPAWFVPMLYFVIVSYVLIRLIFKKWNSVIAFCVMALLGAVSVYFSKSDLNTQYTVLLLKVAFFLPFFELGGLYKICLEKHFQSISKFRIAIVCVLVNIGLIILSGNQMKCKYLYKMGGFLTDITVLPLLTGITGICFWLCITEWLTPVLGKNKLINYISNHTYAIMFHHILFFTIFTYILSKIPFKQSFDYQNFYQNAGWYKFDVFEGVRFLYVIFAIIGCLILCQLYDKIKKMFHVKQSRNVL